jgi:hypothetical protein
LWLLYTQYMRKVDYIIYGLLVIAILGVLVFILINYTTEDSSITPPTREYSYGTETPSTIESTYNNQYYGFSVTIPNGWEATEALKPRSSKAFHEIILAPINRNVSYLPEFIIQVFDNSSGLSIDDWWQNWITEEDNESDRCIIEFGNDAPCISLSDRIETLSKTKFSSYPTLSVELFEFETTKLCLFVNTGEYIFGLCHDEKNPTDPDLDQHKEIYSTILETFIVHSQNISLENVSSEKPQNNDVSSTP